MTHFIEVFNSNGKTLNGVLCESKYLKRNLEITKGSKDLSTVAVWKITQKPHVVVAVRDEDVNAIIVS